MLKMENKIKEVTEQIKKRMGDVREFLEEWSFKEAELDTFISFCEKHSGRQRSDLYHYGKEKYDFRYDLLELDLKYLIHHGTVRIEPYFKLQEKGNKTQKLHAQIITDCYDKQANVTKAMYLFAFKTQRYMDKEEGIDRPYYTRETYFSPISKLTGNWLEVDTSVMLSKEKELLFLERFLYHIDSFLEGIQRIKPILDWDMEEHHKVVSEIEYEELLHMIEEKQKAYL